MAATSLEQLVSLCKRRGFIFPGSEIYGGLQGTYDYGPLGIELKRNLKEAWWKSMVYERDDIEGIDAAMLTNPKVFKYSGHEDTFTDPMVDCRECKSRHRADHIEGKCPNCGSTDLTEPREFNLMFKTQVGPVDDGGHFAYLRPETAQGIFTNFKNVLDSTSRKIPFGIAQIGKSFRNEITPRNFIFRVREFEQMEMEYFIEPGKDEEAHAYWIQERVEWWKKQGLKEENLQVEHAPSDDLAHYAKACADILYKYPHGFEELEGIANRQDFDLGSHTKAQKDFNLSASVKENKDSVAKLAAPHPKTQKPFIPFVVEPAAGVDRGVLAVLTEAYCEEELENGSTRTVLKLPPHLAPIKVAVIPLAKNKPVIVEKAKAVKQMLQSKGFGRVLYEDTGNIGKGYRRHDEVGTPLCVTVDFDTIGQGDDLSLQDTVTVRHRDSLKQERVAIDKLHAFVAEHLQ